MIKRPRASRRSRHTAEAEELIWMANSLADSCNMAEDRFWQDSLVRLVNEILAAGEEDTLNTALDALDTLNASGKIIGVISHVEAMKERIPVQIKVKKINGLGYSRLDKMFAVE